MLTRCARGLRGCGGAASCMTSFSVRRMARRQKVTGNRKKRKQNGRPLVRYRKTRPQLSDEVSHSGKTNGDRPSAQFRQ